MKPRKQVTLKAELTTASLLRVPGSKAVLPQPSRAVPSDSPFPESPRQNDYSFRPSQYSKPPPLLLQFGKGPLSLQPSLVILDNSQQACDSSANMHTLCL